MSQPLGMSWTQSKHAESQEMNNWATVESGKKKMRQETPNLNMQRYRYTISRWEETPLGRSKLNDQLIWCLSLGKSCQHLTRHFSGMTAVNSTSRGEKFGFRNPLRLCGKPRNQHNSFSRRKSKRERKGSNTHVHTHAQSFHICYPFNTRGAPCKIEWLKLLFKWQWKITF